MLRIRRKPKTKVPSRSGIKNNEESVNSMTAIPCWDLFLRISIALLDGRNTGQATGNSLHQVIRAGPDLRLQIEALEGSQREILIAFHGYLDDLPGCVVGYRAIDRVYPVHMHRGGGSGTV